MNEKDKCLNPKVKPPNISEEARIRVMESFMSTSAPRILREKGDKVDI